MLVWVLEGGPRNLVSKNLCSKYKAQLRSYCVQSEAAGCFLTRIGIHLQRTYNKYKWEWKQPPCHGHRWLVLHRQIPARAAGLGGQD